MTFSIHSLRSWLQTLENKGLNVMMNEQMRFSQKTANLDRHNMQFHLTGQTILCGYHTDVITNACAGTRLCRWTRMEKDILKS